VLASCVCVVLVVFLCGVGVVCLCGAGVFQSGCCRATCHRCPVPLTLRALVWPGGMRGAVKSAAPRRGAGRAEPKN
jgi:hypothetical protein